MLIYAFRRHWWVVALIVIADIVIALTVADRLIRWELEQLERAWSGEGQ